MDTTRRGPAKEIQARAVHALKFELAYDLGPLSAGKQRTAALWGTRDGGQSWQSFGTDRGNSGKIAVEVPEEGLYGLRLVSQTQGGIVEFPPARGDLPELNLRVDTTAPVCQLNRVDQYGEELVIAWEAADSELASRPVTLKCQGSAGGPWITIAANLENTGRYSWKVRDHFERGWPPALNLQLEVRDAAGNVGQYVTDTPIRMTWPAQSGRFQTVLPK